MEGIELKKIKNVTIDVKDIPLGRAASHVAFVLRGKDRVDFVYHKLIPIQVHIKNYDKVKIRRASKKIQTRYTGYPSGLRSRTLAALYAKDPKSVFRKSVLGMLPKNKLQKRFISNLIFE